MPTIPLLRDYKKKRTKTDNRAFRQSIYQDKRWRDLRNQYFQEHPLCENCLEQGKVTAGSDIHHIISCFQFKDKEIRESYAFDSDNLYTLCKDCHANLHSNKLEEELYHIYYERKANSIQ